MRYLKGDGDGVPISNNIEKIVEQLHPREKLVLTALNKGLKRIEEISENLGISQDTIRWALSLLEKKKLVKIEKKTEKYYRLGVEGRRYLEKGFPEQRILKKLADKGGKGRIFELNLTEEEKRIGLSWAVKRGWIRIEKGIIKITEEGEKSLKEKYQPLKVLEKINKGEKITAEEIHILLELKKRGRIIEEKERKEIAASLTEIGELIAKKIKPVREVNELTRELIITGRWRNVYLRPYDIYAPVKSIARGKKHPYREIIDEIREILIGLGFEEVISPPIEVNFWNCDALYMPSDHPARGIHDIFYLKRRWERKERAASREIWENVKRTHENGWKTGSTGWGKWNPRLALRLILRSQTTAVSVRCISTLTVKDLPKKIFTIDRNYRPDRIDATHLPEFNQCEGIVVAEDVNFRHLIGYLKTIANAFGISEVKFQPAYFPFTEPSVVGYIKHPKLGWIEALPAGIFRPEVVKPLGHDLPVLAWGLGIDRLAMVALKIEDIRMLFTSDLQWLRRQSTPSIWRW